MQQTVKRCWSWCNTEACSCVLARRRCFVVNVNTLTGEKKKAMQAYEKKKKNIFYGKSIPWSHCSSSAGHECQFKTYKYSLFCPFVSRSMAVDSDSSSVRPMTVASTSSTSSTSSGLKPIYGRERLVQVATTNSATFIQFPTNNRHACLFIPLCPSRASVSSTPVSSLTTETNSISYKSKSSARTPSLSNDTGDQRRDLSQPRANPILNNPLLNHRKEQPKSLPVKSTNEYTRPTRLCLSSRPFRAAPTDPPVVTNRASTAPLFAHPTNAHHNAPDRHMIPVITKTTEEQEQPQQEFQYVDDTKLDYITRWIRQVRAATFSQNLLPTRPRRTKRRFTQS